MPQCDFHCSENIINMLIKKVKKTSWLCVTLLLLINLAHIAPLTCAYRPHEL